MNSNEVDERIRAALNAAANEIDQNDLRADRPPTSSMAGGGRRRARWVAPLLAAAAVIGVAIATTAIVSSPSAHHVAPAGPTSTSVPTPSASHTGPPTTTRAPQPSQTRAPTRATSTPPATNGQNCSFVDFHCPVPSGYVFLQPVWPFPNYAAAQAWQAAGKSGGAQPWHLDAAQTALLFTQNYLGYSDIATVTSSTVDDHGAHVGVGYRLPSGQLHTAAVLHLVRYSPTDGDTSAGWEVVGSDDTDFSLEQPAYGSQVSSPMTVGGHITGVDEKIVVDVQDQSGSVLTGSPVGVAAGGQNSPWQASVSFHGSGVLMIVAFTGGHLQQHERFTIQGVHTA